MAMANYPSSSKRPFSDVEVEVEGGNKKKRSLYQVFISHRGPETKHSLAHHMYDVLKLKGFEVFFDIGEMETGREIPDQIWEAISTSAVQIAIISPGFGESVWCLKELVMMMQKHTDGSSLVIPVFYGVDPSDIKSYDDGVLFWEKFRNEHVRRQSHETMEEWKKALKELADLSGLSWDAYQGKLVELVVERVCSYTHHHHLNIPSYVIGIEKKLVETMEDIRKPQGKVTVVSVTGIGGIGKTTFATALFNNMCSLFKRHCFVDDVKGLGEKYGIAYIQQLLLKGLLNLDIPIFNSGNGQYELKNRLSNQSVLLVLDNIDESVRLSDIFIEDFAILCPSSIVIITSRVTCNFKNDCKIVTVEIPKLDFQKSERLFCSQAFGDNESKYQEEHHMLVRQIVQKCDGIPLALVLFGRHISELDASCWTAFWEMHRDSLPSDLLACLQITYDSLDDLQKKLFLDVAIFFHGEEVSGVRNLWDDNAPEFTVSLNMLRRKHLVEVTEKDCFRMHDILRDLGRAIVDNEDKWNPRGRSRLWRRRDIVSVLSEGLGTDKVKALSLVSEGSVIWDEDENGEPCPWKVDAFSTMPSLEMLFLEEECIEGDLIKLPNGLQFLRWTKFPFNAVSIPLKFAKVVDFSHGRQKRLWNLGSMEAPMKLRDLKLSYCRQLQEILWDRNFRQLKHLDLNWCKSLRSISHNFTSLQLLECLKLQHCDCLESLPMELGRLNLKVLEISHCQNMEELPESFGQLTNLQELDLSYNEKLKKLPESFAKLNGLEVLYLEGCSSLEMLPESFVQLKKLRKLSLEYCSRLKKLPENFGQLKNLGSYFSFFECGKLKKLPESFGDLRQLQTLNLEYCRSLEMLPESFGQLTNLQELYLTDNRKLKNLPESFGKLHRLEVLKMEGCYNLEKLPENFGQLRNLPSKFSLDGCAKLKKLPESFGDLQQLHKLNLNCCTSLEMLPVSLGQLTNLQNLSLLECKELKVLPDSFGQLTNLQKLDLSYNEKLKELPESFGNLHGLEVLHLQGCRSLGRLPENFGQLKNLKSEFSLESCVKLKKLPESFGDLKQLQNLKLKDCHSLEMLPESFGQLTNLQKLDLSYNKELKNLPKLHGLEVLDMEGCYNLEKLPEIFGQLKNVPSDFSLLEFRKLKELPESFGDLQQLQNLVLGYCTSLELLPESLGQLTNLQDLSLRECKELKLLPDSFGQLTNLQKLYLYWNEELKKLPESFGKLHGLKVLHLVGYSSLEMLPENFGQLTNLQELCLFNTDLKTLPDSFGQLTNLQKLYLYHNTKLKKLPESFGKLHGLKILHLGGYRSQKMLPENFGQLTNLQELRLFETDLKTLPDSFGQLTNVQKLYLSDNWKLKKLPESFGQLTNLRELHLSFNWKLKKLPESFGQLTNLQKLDLSGNEELKKLLESFGKLHGLDVFDLDGCINPEMLSDSFGQLTNLQVLKINSCSIKKIMHARRLRPFYELKIRKACPRPLRPFHDLNIMKTWPKTKFMLMEDNLRDAVNHSKKLMLCILNNRWLSNSYRWLEKVPLYPITIMEGYMSDLLLFFKDVRDELTSKGGAILRCLFQPILSFGGTWVAEGEHRKFKCTGAAICFEFCPDVFGRRKEKYSNVEISFGCTKWDPIYTKARGTSLFCMAVYDSLEEISLDKMNVCVSGESLQGTGGWVCYFLERDEDLLRHVRNSFAMVCSKKPEFHGSTRFR